jgi:hypothetical protein
MSAVEYTAADRQMLRELHAAIVGTAKEPGLGEQHRTLRREFDDHTNWNHEDAKEIAASAATAAATAAVVAHEQQRPHVVNRREHFWARIGYDVLRSVLAGVGTTLFLGILVAVIWLGPLIEALRKSVQQ